MDLPSITTAVVAAVIAETPMGNQYEKTLTNVSPLVGLGHLVDELIDAAQAPVPATTGTSLGTAEIVPLLKPKPPRCRSFGCNVVLDGLLLGR